MPSFTSDERQLLHDSLQDYFSSKYNFEHFRSISAAVDGDGFDRTAWAEYAELGWLGVSLPEAAGGSSGGMTELGIVMAAAGGALALEPLLATVVLSASAIELAGTPTQHAILGEIAGGRKILSFCHGEPDAGFARHHVEAIARQDGANYIITGQKSFALHANAADELLISARLGSASGPVALFMVGRGCEGLTVNTAPALDGRRGGTVTLSDVTVDAGARLGDSDDDQGATIDSVLDRGVIAVCAEAAGAMAAVTEQTVEYLKSREQFGQPLSKFQVLQHRLVEMSIACEEVRATIHGALKALDDAAPDARRKIWQAKVQTAKSGRFVGGQAIQLHGGMGMTDELAIGHYYKRISMAEAMFGDGDWYLEQLSDNAA